ncbi:MAG TPA: sigma-70 family RNA polymerase sigma factor [Thermodesulfovibrionales bacterium]|nr:sigma-70 family RNA polymerase sigma factor [Thermodesulfovibrionales bacterium]
MREYGRGGTDEDGETVSRCKRGDLDAYQALVEKYQKMMLNISYRMVGSYEDACEIVQDSFVSAYRGIKGFEGKARFSTWLYAIVVNLSKNRIKQLKNLGHHEGLSMDRRVLGEDDGLPLDIASDDPPADERIERKELQQRVWGCIKALDEEYRAVIVLRDIQGFSYEEMSGTLKVPEGTVKSRLSRAREALKDCLKKVLGQL